MNNSTRKNTRGYVQRQGQIYRFTVGDTEYVTFIWQHGVQFCGRVEGKPQVPEQTGRTALAVRDALRDWLVNKEAAR